MVNRRWVLRLGLVLAAGFAIGCASTPRRTKVVTVPPTAAPAGGRTSPALQLAEIPLDSAATESALRFDREDALRVVIWGHPELMTIAVVQVDGNITLPLVGSVPALGRTAEEIRVEIEGRFAQRIAGGPVRIHKDDVLKLSVWREPELTHSAVVQLDGTVVFPLIGEVRAEGRTIEEIRSEVRQRLTVHLHDPQVAILPEKLLRETIPNPQVSVLPEQVRPRRVAVFGDVYVPGLQPIRGRLRVLEAVSSAGQKESADLNNTVIIRVVGENRVQYRVVRLRDYIAARDAGQNIALRDGDIVVVPRSTIGRIDEFIDKFFTRTKPVYDWWIGLQYARFADEIARTTVDINRRILSP
jgi:polysaccharide export outer membrane protein